MMKICQYNNLNVIARAFGLSSTTLSVTEFQTWGYELESFDTDSLRSKAWFRFILGTASWRSYSTLEQHEGEQRTIWRNPRWSRTNQIHSWGPWTRNCKNRTYVSLSDAYFSPKSYLQDEIKGTLEASQEDVSKGVQMMNNTLETLAKKEKLIFFSSFW